MHIVFHKNLPPRRVTTEEFYPLLLSGEWFDRPQNNLEGNSNEAERLLKEIKGREESRSQLSGIRQCDILSVADRGEPILREGGENASSEGASSSAGTDGGIPIDHSVKKRGRPKKL